MIEIRSSWTWEEEFTQRCQEFEPVIRTEKRCYQYTSVNVLFPHDSTHVFGWCSIVSGSDEDQTFSKLSTLVLDGVQTITKTVSRSFPMTSFVCDKFWRSLDVLLKIYCRFLTVIISSWQLLVLQKPDMSFLELSDFTGVFDRLSLSHSRVVED